ncbi:DUF7935 family protein [Pedobacter zeae]|uniref:Uncharacterized protein n=1 Tax=Pedobacter zeae TaxID=1737356 RepID=A0A7W6P791_9SPHI|nr:hypothetical protein [Pedobacter zeae]MBB4108699.1 hypothetical protein [Pedobacter zeae]GGH07802.1 hypothetical protein GCM10007422_25020 [Pedobacter zeae]
MNTQQILIDVAVLFAGIFAALTAVYYIVKSDIQRFFDLKNIELNKESRAHILPLRLQAHERLILFIDRINPANLFVRLHQQGISIAVLQAGILNEVRSEYQHNIIQQLYIDSVTWNVVRKLKDDTIAMINNAVQGLPADANGIDLSKTVLQHMASIEENPYDLTIELIKKDIHRLF